MPSVLYGRVNSELRYSPVERSVALVALNTVAQSTTVWTPLLVFNTIEGPQFTKGYSFVLANAICLIVTAHIVQYFTIQERKQHDSEGQGNVTSEEGDARDPEAVNHATVYAK